jgi:small subunit ribosomal protein S6
MNYELVYILSPKFSEDDFKKKTKEISDLLKKIETQILKEDFLGKKELAYPIDHFNQGFYILIEFSAEPDKLKEIDKALKLQEGIIRFLIVKKEEKAMPEVIEEKKPARPIKEKEEIKISKEEVKPEKEAVELEKLDKELEEILGSAKGGKEEI